MPAKNVQVTVVDCRHRGETWTRRDRSKAKNATWQAFAAALTITIACTNCDIYQMVEVEHNGGQGYATLPVTTYSVCRRDHA